LDIINMLRFIFVLAFISSAATGFAANSTIEEPIAAVEKTPDKQEFDEQFVSEDPIDPIIVRHQSEQLFDDDGNLEQDYTIWFTSFRPVHTNMVLELTWMK